MLSNLNIDDLPTAEELQVKVVSLNDGKLKIHLPSDLTIATVFVDSRLWKTKHQRKRFKNFSQSCVLSTHRIEIHQSQSLV